jgi:hypothetical protein
MTVTINLRTIVAFATGLAVALIAVFVFQAWRVDAAPGDNDATFVAITPCRLIDTRPGDDHVGPHDKFGVGDTKTIAAHGTNGKCTIPSDAVGLSLNVTALGATAPSFLTIWPDGTMPKASSLNPVPGQPPTPNAVTTNLSGTGSFKVFNLAGSVDVIVDVNGYYTKASLQDLASRLAALEAAQPFSKTARTTLNTFDSAESIVWLSVTAPVDGHVIVNSVTTVHQTTANHGVSCSISASSSPAALDPDFIQRWESPGASGETAQIAGTRRFDITAGATDNYALVCAHSGNDNTSAATDAVLTAIFTPAP